MRLLSVVDRYPPDGGSPAAQWCRQLARRLAVRGHTVEVLTGNTAPPADPDDRGTAGGAVGRRVDLDAAVPAGKLGDRGTVGGAVVRRVDLDAAVPTGRLGDRGTVGGAVVHRVDLDSAVPTGRLGDRVDGGGGGPVPLVRQEAWMESQPGSLARFQSWLVDSAPRYDTVVFFGYGTASTWAGLLACAGRVATVLHPMVVDSTWLRLSLFDTTLRLPSAYAFIDAAEEEVLSRRLGRRCAGVVVGSGDWDTALPRYERLLWVVQSHR